MTAEVNASRSRATGRTLLIVSALGTAGFAGWSLAQLQLSTSETFLSEAWHGFGLIVFAGLFALVAWRPRAYPGLMELTIVHSIGMFVLAFLNQDAAGATATMILHGLLALALLIAYVVLGCIKAWGHQPTAQPSSAGTTRTEASRDSRSTSKGSSTKGRQGRQSAPGSAPRRLDQTPEAPEQPGGQREGTAGTRSGTQPTRPMPRDLPEDRPRSQPGG